MLTKDKLFFAKPEDPDREVIDFIHLCDIVECDLQEDEGTCLMT